jgi:hypothetical protein
LPMLPAITSAAMLFCHFSCCAVAAPLIRAAIFR